MPLQALLGAGEKCCSEVAEIIAHGGRMARFDPAQIPLPVLGFPLLADSGFKHLGAVRQCWM